MVPDRHDDTLAPTGSPLAELCARGRAAAEAREATSPAPPPTGAPTPPAPRPSRHDRRTRLIRPERACIETNLARKGLWQVAARTTGDGLVVRILDTADKLGQVTRLDTGPRLGALELQLMVWLCARWRERSDPGCARVPLTLEGLTEELGWGSSGHNRRQVANALDALRIASFRARIYDARRAELRTATFGLLDRWEAGISKRAGHSATPGFAVLGDWLHEQLRAGFVSYIDWRELRALRRPTAKRLLLFLEAERFPSNGRWSRPITDELLASLGIEAQRERRRRDTLRAATTELTEHLPRYKAEVTTNGSGGWQLDATRMRGGQ